jgi:hypothetical protein
MVNVSYMGLSINGGSPKWLVYNGKSQSKMDDLGIPPFMEFPISMSISI